MDRNAMVRKLQDLEQKMKKQAEDQLAAAQLAEEAAKNGVKKALEGAALPAVKGQEALDALRNTLGNFMTKDEVRADILRELCELNAIQKIELIKDGGNVILEEEPRHYLFGKIMQTVNVGLPVALIGPAGSGKSTLCEQVSKALDLKYHLQNGVSGEHQLTGYMDAHGRYQTTAFRDAFQNGGFILVDEADTSDAGAFKWINTALANGHAAFPDQPDPIKKHPSFRIAIAANTYGTGADRLYVGANQLDASTLDRFVFFDFNYDEKLELVLSGNPNWAQRVQQLRAAAAKEKARVVISPRATLNGSKLFNLGWNKDEVEQSTIWKGMDGELKERILKAANENLSAAPKEAGFLPRKQAA